MRLADVMSAAGLASWTEVALVLCFIVFTAIVIWVFVIRSKPSYDHVRNLPLEENGADSATATAEGGEIS
jgi:cbb3-type cytochrome oxidase subunit 3